MMKRFGPAAVLMTIAVLVGSVSVAGGSSDRNFRAHLAGRNEVPAVDTKATGQAIFQLSKDGDSLRYKLIVANISGVTQAHIHCGADDVNGPVVAFLFGLEPSGVDVNGILSQGTITDADVIPRPDSPQCPGGIANFDELVAKIRAGETYTNVHTVAFPPGEIRGQNF
jgi:hypothetical protein